MVSVYVLELENNKIYVGKSNNPDKRINEHFQGSNCIWTSKYKPIKTKYVIKNCDEYDEDKWTKKMMLEYGIENVRGGSYSQTYLPEYQIKSLEKEFKTLNDKCYNCGEFGHFISDCNFVNNTNKNDSKGFLLLRPFSYVYNKIANIFTYPEYDSSSSEVEYSSDDDSSSELGSSDDSSNYSSNSSSRSDSSCSSPEQKKIKYIPPRHEQINPSVIQRPNAKCFNCNNYGHFARDCPNQCFKCGYRGHWCLECPNSSSTRRFPR